MNPQLPDLMVRLSTKPNTRQLGGAAAKAWSLAAAAFDAKDWAQAERQLRATLNAAPEFAPAWSALGFALESETKFADAVAAYRRAIQTDAQLLSVYPHLIRAQLESQDWNDATATASALIAADRAHQYPQAFLLYAVARYQARDLDGASRALFDAMTNTPPNEAPRLEYMMAAVEEARGDARAAAPHWKRYLQLDPHAADARLIEEHLSGGALTPPSLARLLNALTPEAEFAGEADVPGGVAAFAAIAGLKPGTSRETFFRDYARSIVEQSSASNFERTPGYLANLEGYLASIAELDRLGTHDANGTLLRLSLGGEGRQNTERILSQLGWKVVSSDGALHLEPGDKPSDGPRQRILSAFGVNEIEMCRTLETGREVELRIPSGTAALAGGAAWGRLMKAFPTLTGGMAEALVRDVRLAKAYAGFAAMPADAAELLLRGVGLSALAAEDSDTLFRFSDAFALSAGFVAVPGGAEAAAAWTKLAGANPNDPARFLRAVVTADHGRLAAFYWLLAHADQAHQRFFIASTGRAEHFYHWYRNSDEWLTPNTRLPRVWLPAVFQNLPLDASGNVRFPGGKAAWSAADSSDEEALSDPGSIDTLIAIAQLEEKRNAPFDPASVSLLNQHFNDWRPLFAYFERLPGLTRADFQLLDEFSRTVGAFRRPRQELAMGEWHSLVALALMGRSAGSLDDSQTAQAFRGITRGVLDGRSPLALLREFSDDTDEGVTGGLLRFDDARRAAFDEVRKLLNAPTLASLGSSSDPRRVVTALAGILYGASLDPRILLVREDPLLLSKHQFVPNEKGRLFFPATLDRSNTGAGTRVVADSCASMSSRAT